jgi:O-antigen ligase
VLSWLRNIEEKWIVLGGVLLGLVNAAFIATENYWGLLFPLGLALVAALILALDKVLLFLIFTVPLSIFFFEPDLHIGFTLPTEPILFGVMLLFFFKLLYEGKFDTKVAKHPISVLIILSLVWMLITTMTSEMPLISFKYFLSRLWFVVVFFYLTSQLFVKKKNIDYFFWLYMIPLAGVVIFTLYKHSLHGFDKDTAVWVMFPFFKEHTSYGAVLAMYVPIAFVFAFILKSSLNQRLLASLIFLVLLLGTIFSFTRAAWVGIIAALLVMLIVMLKVRREIVTTAILGFVLLLYLNMDGIMAKFERNKTVSSDNLTEHVESISNISTDASNMERINRWKSAFRMFAERPVFGWGPGTYMFLYAPFQKPHEKTIISTNAGNMGNAHSEYIGPLAEMGVPGSLLILLLVLFTLRTGVRTYYRLDDPKLKAIALATLMGLITYWTHGFLNNFLEMDKAACPVWGFTALLVVLDRYYSKK